MSEVDFTKSKRIHWTQRIALIRHNMHAASTTGDFGFFRTLQAHFLLEGTDHVVILSDALGGEVDHLLRVLDNLNSGIACAHEDAFRNVYDALYKRQGGEEKGNDEAVSPQASTKSFTPSVGEEGHGNAGIKRCLDSSVSFHVTARKELDMAGMAIDKMMHSAIQLLQEQPAEAQDAAANVLILGTTFIADVMQTAVSKIATLERCGDDIARADACLNIVQSSVSAAVSALKGVLNMLESPQEPADAAARSLAKFPETLPGRTRSISSTAGNSVHGALGFFRRMSAVMTSSSSSATSPTTSRKTSTVSLASHAPGTGSQSHGPVFTTIECGPPGLTQQGLVQRSPSGASLSRESAPTPHRGPGQNAGTFSKEQAHRRSMSCGTVNKTLSPIPSTPTETWKNPFEANSGLDGRAKSPSGIHAPVTPPAAEELSRHQPPQLPSLVGSHFEGKKGWMNNNQLAFNSNATLGHVPPEPQKDHRTPSPFSTLRSTQSGKNSVADDQSAKNSSESDSFSTPIASPSMLSSETPPAPPLPPLSPSFMKNATLPMSHRRRRSTNVSGCKPPNLERLLVV